MPDRDAAERRRSERRSIEFQVEVYSLPEQGRQLIEKTVLKDISGTGVCFLSKNPELYTSRQEVILDINMPSTDRLNAVMECRAEIIRMDNADRTEVDGTHWIQIGVTMNTLLSFREREQQQSGDESTPAAH